MAYVGKYTYAGTVKKFLSDSRDTWPKSQFRTWLDSSWDRPKKGKAKHLRINKED